MKFSHNHFGIKAVDLEDLAYPSDHEKVNEPEESSSETDSVSELKTQKILKDFVGKIKPKTIMHKESIIE